MSDFILAFDCGLWHNDIGKKERKLELSICDWVAFLANIHPVECCFFVVHIGKLFA